MIDLQSLNQHVTLHHFKVEEIKLVKGLIQRGNLDGEVGLKRRLSVPIHPHHRRFLRSSVRTNVAIQQSSIRLELGPIYFHQVVEDSSS